MQEGTKIKILGSGARDPVGPWVAYRDDSILLRVKFIVSVVRLYLTRIDSCEEIARAYTAKQGGFGPFLPNSAGLTPNY